MMLSGVRAPAGMAQADALGKVRRLYITKSDIMKYWLPDGCAGCRAIAEGKRAHGHPEGCWAGLEAELAKTDDGTVRLTTAYLRDLARDEESGAAASATAPPTIPAPSSAGEVPGVPMEGRMQWTLDRRENAVLKKVVTRQMTQRVETSSPIKDCWLSLACTRPWQLQGWMLWRRSMLDSKVPATSWRFRFER